MLENKELAVAWVKVIQEYKNQKMLEITGQVSKEPQQLDVNNKITSEGNKQTLTVTENAFMHDALGYGLMDVPRK